MEHDWICLRCDWTGGKNGAACPRCGAPLYRVQEPTGDPMPSSPVDTVQDDESVPPAVPVAASRRWSVIGGGALTVAAVLIVATGLPFDRAATPADKPTRNPEGKTAEDVAMDFVYEIASFETDLAVRHLANDQAVSRLGLDGIGQFRRWLSFNEATGFQVIPTSCEKTGSSSLGTYVRCMFEFHGIRSEAIGRGPYGGSYFDLVVHDTPQEWGAIRDVSVHLEAAKFGPQMVDPFIEWVSSTYPKDAAIMGLDGTRVARFSPESIQLWEWHTREYVETETAETAPPSAPASTAPDVGHGTCSDGAKWRLELTHLGQHLGDWSKVRFEVHRSPVGDEWHIRLVPSGRVIPDYFTDTMVASDSGVFLVQFRYRDLGQDWLRGKAVDRQTGQICRVGTTLF